MAHFTISLLTLGAVLIGLGLALRVEVTPEIVSHVLPEELTIACLTEVAVPTRKNVVTLEILKPREKPFVIVSHAGLRRRHDIPVNMLVQGQLDKGEGQSYVKLTIKKPRLKDLGTYSCLMYYIDGEMQFKEDKAHANVTVEDEDTTLVMTMLSRKISDLEKSAKEQADALARQNVLVSQLTDTISSQKNKLEEQENLLKDQESRLKIQEKMNGHSNTSPEQGRRVQDEIALLKSQQAQLMEQNVNVSSRLYMLEDMGGTESQFAKDSIDKESYNVAFSYGYSPDDKFEVGQTLIFTDEILNKGDAYNPENGIFTAPFSGLYVFHLAITTWKSGANIYINVMANDRIVGSLKAEDKSVYDQSSVSVIVSLEAGDTVNPQVIGSNKQFLNSVDHFSFFAGYLLRPIISPQ